MRLRAPASAAVIICAGYALMPNAMALPATLQGAPSPPPAATSPGASASPAATAPPAPGSQTILLPGGTNVAISLSEPISSGNAKVGDQFAIVVKKEVDAGGWIVIPAGAAGHATITSAEGASTNGSGGKLALSVDWVYSEDGGKVALSPTNHASENGDNKGAASTATLLSWALLGPLGFFAHNFVRGHDVTIGTDKTFVVFVDHDVHVQTAVKANAGPGFDK
jgi:hypothetical protein